MFSRKKKTSSSPSKENDKTNVIEAIGKLKASQKTIEKR